MAEPDPSLLERCQQGDDAAFSQLVIDQQDYVYTLARKMLRDPEEAADLAQEVFVQVWRGLPSFRRESRFRTWLYRIVVNLGLNRLRRSRREPGTVSLDAPRSAELPPSRDDPYSEAWQRERREQIWREVGQLPLKYQLVLSLYYQQELSCADIADVLSMPVGTVKTHLHRARRALVEALPRGGQDAL